MSEFEPGTTVALTATAADGFQFVRWDGDANGSVNPLSLVMNSNMTVSAVFEPWPQAPTIALRKEGNGLVIEWRGSGTLQVAAQLTGPWTDLDVSISPAPI